MTVCVCGLTFHYSSAGNLGRRTCSIIAVHTHPYTSVCVQYFPVSNGTYGRQCHAGKKACEDLIGCNNGVTKRPEANTARASVEVKAEAWIL